MRRRLMYLGFQGLRVVVQALPVRASRALGRVLGVATFSLLRGQRRLTEDHLAYAFGDSLTPLERRRIARRVFVNLGQCAVEWLWMPRLSSSALQQLIVSEGLEHLRATMAQGKGAILVTAHFGNWEAISLYLGSLGFEGGVLARRLRYPEYESLLVSMRGAKGISTLARGSIKEVAKLLRANQIIGMLPDQDIDSLEGVFVNFFGHPAHTPVGPAALSLMTGSPILPCFLIREGARFRLVIEPPIPVPQTADRAQALAILTQAWSDIVESYVRRYPDQWVWMHRRWKTQPQPAASTQQQAVRAPITRSAVSSTAAAILPTSRRADEPTSLMYLLCAVCCVLGAGMWGCARSAGPSATGAASKPAAAANPDQGVDQQMSAFTLTGYDVGGAKRWELEGTDASVDGDITTIHHPDAKGYDPTRTAYLTASIAQVNQKNRRVRWEHNVTIHTSDGLWFSSPVVHWIPDQDQVATDQPVRMETDHMILHGRGMRALTHLKHATVFEDIELVLNPGDHETLVGEDKHVTITCDGPLSFDYENNIATFEKNVHVKDPNGDLYSDKLIAYLNQTTHTIRYAEAIGDVRIYQHQNTALSERAVYEPAIGKVTLVGKPSLLVYPSEGHEATTLPFGGLVATPGGRPGPPLATAGTGSGAPAHSTH